MVTTILSRNQYQIGTFVKKTNQSPMQGKVEGEQQEKNNKMDSTK